MADLLAQGAAWLAEQRTQHAAQTVSYQRGANVWVLQATRGRTEFEEEDLEGGGVQRIEARDYLIRVADLVAGPPLEGDRILDAGRVYEVASLAGQPPWVFTNVHQVTYRIHTKPVQP